MGSSPVLNLACWGSVNPILLNLTIPFILFLLGTGIGAVAYRRRRRPWPLQIVSCPEGDLSGSPLVHLACALSSPVLSLHAE